MSDTPGRLTHPAREIRSLVARRRDVLTTLGATFAALGIFLDNVLDGALPPSLAAVRGRVFATYTFLLLVPAAILALRLARLNAGMVLNGILFSHALQNQAFTKRPDPARAAKVNPVGVSFLMSLLTDFIAGISAALLVMALGAPPAAAVLSGVLVAGVCLAAYLSFHKEAVRLANAKAAITTFEAPNREDWEAHMGGSLEDANQDMIAVLALTGLIIFSAFQSLSGLGSVTGGGDLPSETLKAWGPLVYGVLMTVTCFVAMLTYLRLRLAAGNFARVLDPEDRPFRALRVTDSLLGYTLLAFLFALSLHVTLFPALGDGTAVLGISIAAFVGAIALEQIVVARAGR